MSKVIYISPLHYPFVQKDIDILKKHFDVVSTKAKWDRPTAVPILLIRQFMFLLRHAWGARATFVMFGGYWALLPALFGKITGKPVYIILGGTECVSFPSIRYGSLRKPFLRRIIKWSFALAERLLPVDDALVYREYSYRSGERTAQGFRSFFPKLKTPHTTIHNGFDLEFWQDQNSEKKENTFITVSKIYNETRFTLKGVDMMFEMARRFPTWEFIVVGLPSSMAVSFGQTVPTNVQCHDFLEPQVFRNLLRSSQYYMQLSISEGFPNALAEGMLCECIPIGSNVGGIPHIIGDTGLVVTTRDAQLIGDEIERFVAEHSSEEKQELAQRTRQRIVDNFGIDVREKAMIKILDETDT